ncbi:hypothetical protein GQ43DRAFT_266256 [Delitschia confertaspora ATCC 74209]|uniref:Arf-GAP domain-containing protein n=1 Tax=Delitschia confertaspora ATCC 74209 TaxID=1513339 RepID=A0A9P4MMT5_9PLEO|nr:hypothetical protein GQ43DRAFT_266256 [Delitschia confertaspora ATCC 74209]
MRCATLHRKLGTHVSKVKSLSMDKWDNAQVDNMKRIGNRESNKTFNPRNVKPQIPVDVDEVDSAMERFIRQKYEQRAFMNDSAPGTRQNTGSNSSVEDRPPPLPPKPSRRFGFGLQKSSTFPRNATPPISPGVGGFGDTTPPRLNKPSRVFGSSISTSSDGFESKLATLRDMGFPDDKRNTTVLKGLNGNIDKTVETLIRLGEQNPGPTGDSAPPPPAKSGANGITITRTQTEPASTTKFMNPFDALDTVAPPAPVAPAATQQPQPLTLQTQQFMSAGSYSQTASPANPYNPFLAQAQQQMQYPQHQAQQQAQQQQQQQQMQQMQQMQYQQQQPSIEQSFQNMQQSNLQQPDQQSQQPSLFPNRTGGYNQSPQYQQTNPFQHSFTPPPMPPMPQYPFYANQQQQPTPTSPTNGGNPFLKSARSQMFHPQQPQAMNPFLVNHSTPATPQSNVNPWQQQQQQQLNMLQPRQTGFDKSSIMALYNYPQLAPTRPEQVQTLPAPVPEATPAGPVPGSLNPFAATQNPLQGQAHTNNLGGTGVPGPSLTHQGTRHVSNESVDFAGLMGGRHSPDAFSGLSASYRR